MKRYPFKNVPKGKRLSHFFTYYSWHLAAAIFVVVVVSYTIFVTFIKPKSDASIMWISSTYALEADESIYQRLQQLGWDNNGDGKTMVTLQHAEFGETYANTSASDLMSVMTVISAGNIDIMLVNDAALEWGLEAELYGTYADMGGLDGYNDEDIFIISCADIPFFAGTDIDIYETMYLTIAQSKTGTEHEASYLQNMQNLRRLLEWEDENV